MYVLRKILKIVGILWMMFWSIIAIAMTAIDEGVVVKIMAVAGMLVVAAAEYFNDVISWKKDYDPHPYTVDGGEKGKW